MNPLKKPYLATLAFAFGIGLFLVTTIVVIVNNEQIASAEETIILETRPVDPRDLFRGEYVILRYQIEEDPVVKAAIAGLPSGTSVSVFYAKDTNGRLQVTHIKPEYRPDQTNENYLSGVVEDGLVRFYSLEQFYVPEGSGYAIEQIPREELYARVAVRNGEARVIELLDRNLEPIVVGKLFD